MRMKRNSNFQAEFQVSEKKPVYHPRILMDLTSFVLGSWVQALHQQ